MNLSLRQLRLFEATVRLGRLGLAAQEQAISQSAASQALKELERALGYSVLERVGRELVVTDAGQTILPRVRQILNLSDSLTQPDDRRIAGILRIAASVTIASYLLPGMIARFRRQHPDADAKLEITNTEGVLSRLEKGQAQLGLIEGPALHPSLDIVPWRSDQLVVFCGPDHPLARKSPLDTNLLADQEWILREAGSGTRAVLDAAMQAQGLKPRVALELTRHEAIKQSVRAGLGIGCLSGLIIADEVAAGQLIPLETALNLTRRFSWVCSPEHRNHALIQALLPQLKAPQLKDPAASGDL
ncbi:LysR substrate-binding domain-containing protein [Marinobacterium rhizophilum]|uniref:LysR family transcriptional regulator n=1 Tax=Marinobacterium rhizophilum TaxID=420402 RepID=A0ABY5HHC7_9GAMM|nr:LysR substrate-binding domain-containing protein [Marinobacterium rhizophilum]UTW11384.1 LysR family transcriptional regulator [Marinobacterium rhizophilum]